MSGHLLIFGQGFTGARLAEACRADGWTVTGTGRQAREGVLPFDRNHPLPKSVLASVTHLVISIPPDEAGDAVLNLHGEAIGRSNSLQWVGYLSTTGVYGDHGGAWVDEKSETNPTAARSKRRLAAEHAWLAWGKRHDKPVQIFRLAGIYGPGRSPLDRVRSGGAQRINKPGQVFGRIHVDDIVRVVRAAMAKPEAGPIFNLADDHPASSAQVLAYAAELLGVEPPPEVPFEEANLSSMARSFYTDNRRVCNKRIKQQLGVCLLYPSYREGLRALAGQPR